MQRAWPMVLFASLFLATLVPGGAACTSAPGPYHAVRFVVTEDGQPLLDIPTSIRVGPNDLCGYDNVPRLSFDGRFAAWPEAGGSSLRVVDVANGTQSVYPRGVLTGGHVALLDVDGPRPNVTLVDLAGGTTRVAEAPPGHSFVKNFEGGVVAQDNAGHVSVLDPVTGEWLLYLAPLPSGNLDAYAGSRDWVVFGYGQQMRALDVATGEVTAMSNPAGPDAFAYGIAGDRVYLYAHTSSTMSWGGDSRTYWSVRLPFGTDRQEDTLPPVGPQAGRSASFVVQPEPMSSGTSSGTPGTTSGGLAGGFAGQPPATDGSTAASAGSEPDLGLDVPASMGLGLAAVAVLGLAAGVRRRL